MALARRPFLGVVAVGAAALAGCSGGGAGNGDGAGDRDGGSGGNVRETSEVTMVNTQFDPRNVHVDAGTELTWTNEDSHAHTVTDASDNWEMDAEVAGGGETSHSFGSDGVYDVYCRFHGSADLSGMSMKVGVGEATIENPLGGGGNGDGGDSNSGGGGPGY